MSIRLLAAKDENLFKIFIFRNFQKTVKLRYSPIGTKIEFKKECILK